MRQMRKNSLVAKSMGIFLPLVVVVVVVVVVVEVVVLLVVVANEVIK